jgi:hypothetical protein
MKKILTLTIISSCFFTGLFAQEVPIENLKFIYFPHPQVRKSTTSIGISATTMPYEITEELHYRIPALDVHTLRKINDHFHLEGRASIQGVQNLLMIGPKWATKVTDRVSVAAGYDVGFWFGFIKTEGFNTKGRGWQNFPNVSVGYRFNKAILLTFKAESIITLSVDATADKTPIQYNYSRFSGSAYSVLLEQPFYGNKSLTLGLRAIYTKFYWQTWSAFTNFDRDFFYPQLIVGLIL